MKHLAQRLGFLAVSSALVSVPLNAENLDVVCQEKVIARAFVEPILVEDTILSEETEASKRLELARKSYIVPLNGFRLEEELVFPGADGATVPAKTEFQFFNNMDTSKHCTYVRVNKKRRLACLHDDDNDGVIEAASLDLRKKSGLIKIDLATPPKTRRMEDVYSEEQDPTKLHIGTPYLTSRLVVMKAKKKQIEFALYAGAAYHHKPLEERKKSFAFGSYGNRVEKLKLKAKDLDGPVKIGDFEVSVRRDDNGKWFVSAEGGFGDVEPILHCEGSAVTIAESYVRIGNTSVQSKSGILVENYDFRNDRYTNDAVISF